MDLPKYCDQAVWKTIPLPQRVVERLGFVGPLEILSIEPFVIRLANTDRSILGIFSWTEDTSWQSLGYRFSRRGDPCIQVEDHPVVNTDWIACIEEFLLDVIDD